MRVIAAIAGFVVVCGLIGIAVLYSGVVSVAATEPHFPGMRWLLTTGMERSVRHHARNVEAPPLADGALVLRGAGQFEGVCAPCHGAPGVSRAVIGEGELPIAPELSAIVPKWNAAELYWIVKHGIKYTGMPAFGPTHRDDELWSIVAFLLRLPDLSPAEYRRMAGGIDVPSGGELIALGGPAGKGQSACARCHGLEGEGAGAFPRLAGQSEAYLYQSLKSYASGARPSGIMGPIARILSDDEMKAVSSYYASITDAPYPPVPEAATRILQRGGALSAIGADAQGVPACRGCHGPSGTGGTTAYPYLAGQHADYLALQLKLWKAGERGGGPDAEVMADIARALTVEQIEAVSLYFASVRPNAITRDMSERGMQETAGTPVE